MSLIYAQDVSDLCRLLYQAEATGKTEADLLERTRNGEVVLELAQAIQKAAAAQNALDAAVASAGQQVATGPRTHALVIGVGAYPHLPGGALFSHLPAAVSLSLGQLTTSVLSAQAVSNWLLTRFCNDGCPLGSIELLLSPGTYTPSQDAADRLGLTAGSSVPVKEATLQHIEVAFSRWLARCNSLRDNIALFYFSGHGVATREGNSILLPTDFGENPTQPFDRCVNLTSTHRLMGQSNAKTQCFFIDACRETPFELLSSREDSLGVCLKGDTRNSFSEREAPIYHSAAEGRKAFGPPNDVTYFTKELLRCLDGLGAETKQGRHWRITSDSLRTNLKRAMNRFGQLTGKPITCDTSRGDGNESTDLHWVDDPVPVFTTVRCKPAEAHSAAVLIMMDEQNDQIDSRVTRGNDPWLLEVPSGNYRVHARFDDNSAFDDSVSEVSFAHPPEFTPDLKVARRDRS